MLCPKASTFWVVHGSRVTSGMVSVAFMYSVCVLGSPGALVHLVHRFTWGTGALVHLVHLVHWVMTWKRSHFIKPKCIPTSWSALKRSYLLFQMKRQPKRGSIYCSCLMPITYGDMVQCDDCKKWFHLQCVGVVELAAEDNWRCCSCMLFYTLKTCTCITITLQYEIFIITWDFDYYSTIIWDIYYNLRLWYCDVTSCNVLGSSRYIGSASAEREHGHVRA